MCVQMPTLLNIKSHASERMPRSRLMAPGSGGLNWGVNRLGNQGGGNKKEGLVSTTNTRSSLVSHIRTRADGGNARNWVFCINQLGGVGHRWGQAAGPGNRGGVHAPCHALADLSRKRYPRRLKPAVGYGPPTVYRSIIRQAPSSLEVSDNQCSVTLNVDDWKDKSCNDQGDFPYVDQRPGLVVDSTAYAWVPYPESITLTIPWTTIAHLTSTKETVYFKDKGGGWSGGESVWNGLTFTNGGGGSYNPEKLMPLLQPVVWKGANFCVPSKNNNTLPNYIAIYDQDARRLTVSDAWNQGALGGNNKSLQEYYKSSKLGPGSGRTSMKLRYLEQDSGCTYSWKVLDSVGDETAFHEKISDHQEMGGLFVNAQYVEVSGQFYSNGNNSFYDQIADTIIAIPSPNLGGCSWPDPNSTMSTWDGGVVLTIRVGADTPVAIVEASVQLPTSLKVSPASPAPLSTLSVTSIHAPSTNNWSAGTKKDPGVFRTIPIPSKLPNWRALPIQVEIGGNDWVVKDGAGPKGDFGKCGETISSVWDGTVYQLQAEPAALLAPASGMAWCQQTAPVTSVNGDPPQCVWV